VLAGLRFIKLESQLIQVLEAFLKKIKPVVLADLKFAKLESQLIQVLKAFF
jgi:hypothetical protein